MGLKYENGIWYDPRWNPKPKPPKPHKKRGRKPGYKVKNRKKTDLQMYLDYGYARKLGKKWTKKQLRIKKIFYMLGGYKKAMELLKITSYSTISKWIEREMIPVKYLPKISQAFDNKLSAGELAKILLSD